MPLKKLKKRWKEETSFKPHVYRVVCKSSLGNFRTEQMESRRQAKAIKKLFNKYPHVKSCKIKKEKIGKFQEWERKKLKKMTSFLEHFIGG